MGTDINSIGQRSSVEVTAAFYKRAVHSFTLTAVSFPKANRFIAIIYGASSGQSQRARRIFSRRLGKLWVHCMHRSVSKVIIIRLKFCISAQFTVEGPRNGHGI